MTGTTESNINSTSTAGGPGRLVREAREQIKLTLEDLAAQIKLARNTLDAIERDDFAQLNEPVYVRGYYRKLAKVLPVDELDLLSAYERVAGHREPPHPSKLILAGDGELGGGRRISIKLALAILVAGLLLGTLAFWGKNRSETALPQSPAVTVLPQTDLSSPAAPNTSLPASAPEAVAPPDAGAAAPPADAAPLVGEPAAAAETSPTPNAGAATQGPLQLQFDGTSWTEVKDATGKVLLSGLVEAGNSQTLDGKPPFVVFLGNAPVVRVTFNGQRVDTTAFRRGDNTARIVLP